MTELAFVNDAFVRPLRVNHQRSIPRNDDLEGEIVYSLPKVSFGNQNRVNNTDIISVPYDNRVYFFVGEWGSGRSFIKTPYYGNVYSGVTYRFDSHGEIIDSFNVQNEPATDPYYCAILVTSDSTSIDNDIWYIHPESEWKRLETNTHWLPYAIAELKELENLESGWDGYRGKSVSSENVQVAIDILKRIVRISGAPIPQISPGVGGDLQIEWHGKGRELEIHIIDPNNVQIWILNEGSYPGGIEFKLDTDFTKIEQQIREFAELYRDRRPSLR